MSNAFGFNLSYGVVDGANKMIFKQRLSNSKMITADVASEVYRLYRFQRPDISSKYS